MTWINFTAIISRMSSSLLYLCSDHIMWGTVVRPQRLALLENRQVRTGAKGTPGLLKSPQTHSTKIQLLKIQNHSLCVLQVKVDIQELNLNKLCMGLQNAHS